MNIKEDNLYIGNVGIKYLKEKYNTPLYIYDEKLIINNCREYKKHFKVKENNNRVAYAGKAFIPKYMCKLIDSEGMYLDVVSGGELYTAYKSNFPMEKILFHGNNKTLEEIENGIELGVGIFVVDNYYELENIQSICSKKNKIQDIYFRITPGIEAHTHEYIKTGQKDSKFGFSVLNGDLDRALSKINEYNNVNLVGLHAHIGSQIFDKQPFLDEVEIMMNLVKRINKEYNIEIKDVDLGGGIGVYYTNEDHPSSIKSFCEAIIDKVDEVCESLNIKTPILIIEPGRSIVANAGSIIYTVGAIKEIKNVRTYVSVDGGMTDNIRPSLYHAQYECAIANKMNEKEESVVTISGKCCESGDILINNIKVSKIESGDILIVPTVGAYGYSMSSNYNKLAKPAVVFVNEDEDKLVCKRQSYEDMLSLEL